MVAEGGEHDIDKAKQRNKDQDHGKNLTSTPVILSRQDLCASSQHKKEGRKPETELLERAWAISDERNGGPTLLRLICSSVA
jgi:hypothetical protein